MMVSIRDLRTFLAIAESGSFAAASRSVRRTQSAVTVQMKALEDEFGIVLFDRARRPYRGMAKNAALDPLHRSAPQ